MSAEPSMRLSALGHQIACQLGGDLPPQGPPPVRLPKVLSVEQCEALVKAAWQNTPHGTKQQDRQAHRDRALVLWLWGTGCRVSEMCCATVGDYDPIEGTCKVIGKGNRERLLYIPNRVVRAYNSYLALRGGPWANKQLPLFGSSKDDAKRLERFSVNRILKRISEGINIHVTPHMFRHSCATQLLQAGVAIDYVRAYLGHVRITTTQTYTHAIVSGAMREATTFHPAGR